MVAIDSRDTLGRILPGASVEERFAASYQVRDDGCWEWTEGRTGGGYGAFYPGERQIGAHVWSYRAHVGPIPHGAVIDHKCRNRGCVNPGHLEPTGRGDNVLRSPVSNAGRNQRKTECDRGHPLAGDNLVLQVNARNPELPPWRQCRTCANERKRARRRDQREAV